MPNNYRFILKLIALLLTFGLLFTLSWHSFVSERIQQPSVQEVAPAQKTTAELLVGKWKVIEGPDGVFPEDWEITEEFTSDGKHISRLNYPNLKHLLPEEMNRELVSSYILTGTTIQLSRPALGKEPARRWEVQILSISDQKLCTRAGFGDDQQVDVSVRLAK